MASQIHHPRVPQRRVRLVASLSADVITWTERGVLHATFVLGKRQVLVSGGLADRVARLPRGTRLVVEGTPVTTTWVSRAADGTRCLKERSSPHTLVATAVMIVPPGAAEPEHVVTAVDGRPALREQRSLAPAREAPDVEPVPLILIDADAAEAQSIFVGAGSPLDYPYSCADTAGHTLYRRYLLRQIERGYGEAYESLHRIANQALGMPVVLRPDSTDLGWQRAEVLRRAAFYLIQTGRATVRG